jgi:uncharacterized protein
MTQALSPQLQAFIGQLAEPPITMRDPIDRSAIRRYSDALGDTNPAYIDHDYAARSARRGVIAPTAMLDAWTMPHYDPDRPVAGDHMPVLAELANMGYTCAVAIEIEQEYVRELRLGDVVTQRKFVESISPEKSTGLGTGRFVCIRSEFCDQNAGLVGVMRMTLLKFKPRSDAS